MRKVLALAVVAGLLMVAACDTVDTTNPIVTFAYPTNGATVGVGSVTIKVVATDNKGVVKVEFYDGATKIGEDGTTNADTFDVSWTSTAGSHTLRAVASDAADNTGEASITVTVGGTSGPTYHSGTISQSETWWPSGNPHIITGDVSVQDAANSPVLTVMPGCIVEFQGDYELFTGYSQSGAIVANGKAGVADADSGILFTTTISPKVPGSWGSIGVYYRATSATSFKYCTFEYGGSEASRGTFYVDGAKSAFENCMITQSASGGAVLQNDASFASFMGNTISNCGGHAVQMYPEYVKTLGSGNTYSGNTNNGILVRGGTVSTTATWLNQGVPYVLGGDISVQDPSNSPVLTIAPGCSLKFNGDHEFFTGYTQPGAIVAEGTASAPIVFSTGISPKVPGSWASVSIYYRATSATSFKYCTFEYGGSAAAKGTFYVDGAKSAFENCMITQSANSGAVLQNDASFASFTGNTISNCGNHAVEIYPEYVKTLLSGNTYSGNTNNDILVKGGTVSTTATWLNQGAPYTLGGDVSVQDASNSPVLTIAPGTTVKLQSDAELYCGYTQPGGIIADGTAGQITFTSYLPTPTPGDWASISFYYLAMNSQCQLKNCRFEYGGSHNGNIYIDDAVPTITGCDIGYSSDYGIYLTGTEYPDPATLRANNTFHDNASGDIREP
jgi:hypothetical protein